MENKTQPKKHKNGTSMRRYHNYMHSAIEKCKNETIEQCKIKIKMD